MSQKIDKFLRKHQVEPCKISTIMRKDGKTILSTIDGKEVETFISVKIFQEEIAEKKFVMANKGTLVAMDQIDRVEKNIYYLKDGRTIEGRRRRSLEQRNLVHYVNEQLSKNATEGYRPMDYSVLEDMPVAFCVIELVFNGAGHGVDFVFRYCNKQMVELEGKPMEEMLNRSFFQVFDNADPKWLVAYADVAVNGTLRHISDYSPEIDKTLEIYCFRPANGYCACLLLPREN